MFRNVEILKLQNLLRFRKDRVPLNKKLVSSTNSLIPANNISLLVTGHPTVPRAVVGNKIFYKIILPF